MLTVPGRFATTHPTAGLPGYPARDFFGRPGERVVLGFAARVDRLSGRSCSEGGAPGGAYGRSVYVRRPSGDRYYLTHLTLLAVERGDWIEPGETVGHLCDSAVTGRPGTTHVHVGFRRARRPPLWKRAAAAAIGRRL